MLFLTEVGVRGTVGYMYIVISVFITALVLGAVLVYTDSFRLLKTIWLISSVAPYEQIVPNAPVILVLGDSTGYGTGAKDNTKSIAGRMGSDFPTYTIVNRSVNGRTIKDALLEIRTFPDEKKYHLILLQLGGNDILQKRPVSVVKSELEILREEALKRATTVVLMTSGNVGGAPAFKGKEARDYEARTRELRAIAESIFATPEARYVDLFLEPEQDIIAQSPKVYLAFDGLHPNEVGYGVWYESLKLVLVEILKK